VDQPRFRVGSWTLTFRRERAADPADAEVNAESRDLRETPIWKGPGEFGAPAAFATKTGVAAPLLAGFSITLIGVIGQAPSVFKWPAATMLLLVVDAALMIACIQFGFRGQLLLYSRNDVEQWLPLTQEPYDVQLNRISAMQRLDNLAWRSWYSRSRFAYNLGILFLGASICLALAPPNEYVLGTPLTTTEHWLRWSASAAAALATLAEFGWILWDLTENRRKG
jgi:hypothetical protein